MRSEETRAGDGNACFAMASLFRKSGYFKEPLVPQAMHGDFGLIFRLPQREDGSYIGNELDSNLRGCRSGWSIRLPLHSFIHSFQIIAWTTGSRLPD
jgi:hypothetical protein